MTDMDDPYAEFENLYYFPLLAIRTRIKERNLEESVELDKPLNENDLNKLKVTIIQNPSEEIGYAFIDFGKENTTMDVSNHK